MKFTYNAFGELLSRKDALGLSTTYQYDILGRITQQTSPEGTKYYNYYHSGNGIRQLAGIVGPGGVTEGIIYDNFGRVSQYSRSITNEISMNLSYSYDQYGNNTAITYPSGLVIQNVFDQYGNLTEIRKSDGTLIWQLNSITAAGKPAEVTLGPGTFTRSYEYDSFENISSIVSWEWRQSFNFDGASGNLMSRSYMNGDLTFMRTENFQYDTRERLTTSQVTGQDQKVVTYDQTGNILTKTDAGTYTYNSAKVNALASVTFIRSGISTDLQNIAYNSQNKATAISEDVNSYNIVYGADGERIKSQLYNNSVLSKTKYFAPGYEKITTTGGTVENHYRSSPFGLESIIVKAGTSETMYLAETDHLGSLTGLKNTAGVYVERYSYDAWGRRRNPSDWSFDNVPATTITDRGFTGHEHLDKFRLINMNGRLYVPVTGRFLNADPVIDNTGGAQGLNSYTYCLNNPLKYTDPTGYIFRRPQEFEWVDFSEAYYNALRISGYSSPWFDYEFLIGSGGLSRTTTNTQDKITYDQVLGEFVHSDGTVATEEELDALINGKPSAQGGEQNSILDNLKYAIPVAITWAAVGSAEGIMAGQVTPAGYGIILRGPNRFQSIGFSSAGAGAGWVGADGSIATTYYFYTGDVNNFNRFSLDGQAWELSVTCGEGWSVGINLAVAQDRYGAYIIGIGPSAGVGASPPTFFNGQYSMTLTKIWR
jgi:RHS repeat-associated protein